MEVNVRRQRIVMSWKCWAFKIQRNRWMCSENRGIQNIKYRSCQLVQVPMTKIHRQRTHRRWPPHRSPHKKPIPPNQWPILCQMFIHSVAINCFRIRFMAVERRPFRQSIIWTRTAFRISTKTFIFTNRHRRMRFSINHRRAAIICSCPGITFAQLKLTFEKKKKNTLWFTHRAPCLLSVNLSSKAVGAMRLHRCCQINRRYIIRRWMQFRRISCPAHRKWAVAVVDRAVKTV